MKKVSHSVFFFFFFKLKDLGKDSTFLKSYVSFISIAFLFWLCIFPLDVKLHDVFVSQRYLKQNILQHLPK